MTKFTWSGTLIVLALSAVTSGLAAQSSTSPNSQAPATPAAQSSGEGLVSVTGCLREAAASAPAESAPPPNAADAAGKADPANAEAKFVLAEATQSAAGSPPSDAQEAARRTYQLVANGDALRPHIGKKLELTGSIDPSASAGSPRLVVQSGKVVTGSCTP